MSLLLIVKTPLVIHEIDSKGVDRKEDIVLGYAMIRKNHESGENYISYIATNPSANRQEIGSAIMQDIFQRS